MSIDIAIAQLEGEVNALISDGSIRPLDAMWFVLQARGQGLSLLRGMKAAGVHLDAKAADNYRKSIKVKGLTVAV